MQAPRRSPHRIYTGSAADAAPINLTTLHEPLSPTVDASDVTGFLPRTPPPAAASRSSATGAGYAKNPARITLPVIILLIGSQTRVGIESALARHRTIVCEPDHTRTYLKIAGWPLSRQEQGTGRLSPGPDSRISAAVFSAQLMQTPARSIPQPVQLQLDS